MDALLYLIIKWIIRIGKEAAFEIDGAINLGHCDCIDLLFIKPPDIQSILLDCLDDITQLLDGARSQLRALRGESEPHDGFVPSSVDEDVFDCYVLRLALDCILESWLAL